MTRPPIKMVSYKGRPLKLYAIGWLAFMCNRKSITVRYWERNQIIPKPILGFGPNQFRYYTVLELLMYSRLAAREMNGTAEGTRLFRTACQEMRQKIFAKLEENPESCPEELPDAEQIMVGWQHSHSTKILKGLRELQVDDRPPEQRVGKGINPADPFGKKKRRKKLQGYENAPDKKIGPEENDTGFSIIDDPHRAFRGKNRSAS